MESDWYDDSMKSVERRNFVGLFFPIRASSSSSLKSAASGLFIGPVAAKGCWLGDLPASLGVLGVGDDETAFSLKRISTNGRADEVFLELD